MHLNSIWRQKNGKQKLSVFLWKCIQFLIFKCIFSKKTYNFYFLFFWRQILFIDPYDKWLHASVVFINVHYGPSMMCHGKAHWKHPSKGFKMSLMGLSKITLNWKDPSDPCKSPLGVFPRGGLSLEHHWQSIVYILVWLYLIFLVI